MKEVIKIGVIGCGTIAERIHFPLLDCNPNFNIVSMCDSDISRAEKLANQYQISNIYQSPKNFIKEGLDAIIISTPNLYHALLSINALNNNISVLCEKPMAINLEDATKIIEYANISKGIYQVAYNNRYRKDIQKVKEVIDSNILGNVLCIKCGWLRKDGIPGKNSWFTTRKYSGGGALIDIGSHVIDILLWIINYKYVSVTKAKSEKDYLNTNKLWYKSVDNNLRYKSDVETRVTWEGITDNDIRIECDIGWKCDINSDITYFHIYCKKGTILLNTAFGLSPNINIAENSFIIKGNGKYVDLNNYYETPFDSYNAQLDVFYNKVMNKSNKNQNCEDILCVELIDKIYTLCREGRR